MPRALLALLLLVGGGSPFLSVPGIATLFKVIAAADGQPRTDVGRNFDPNGSPTTQEDPDAGSRWDPDG